MKELEEENLNEVEEIKGNEEFVELTEEEANEVEGGASASSTKVWNVNVEKGCRKYCIGVNNGQSIRVLSGSVDAYPSRYYEGRVVEYVVAVKKNIGYGTINCRVVVNSLSQKSWGDNKEITYSYSNTHLFNIRFDLGTKWSSR